jgi:hypothetical protein
MTKNAKIIVLDANILIRAVLGIRTFSLIAQQRHKVLFCTPQICYHEVGKRQKAKGTLAKGKRQKAKGNRHSCKR